jgi:hypothetical protein
MSGPSVVWRLRACLPFVAALLAISGCSASDDGLPRQAVVGTVLLDGQRLTQGSILFEPIKRSAKAGSRSRAAED